MTRPTRLRGLGTLQTKSAIVTLMVQLDFFIRTLFIGNIPNFQ